MYDECNSLTSRYIINPQRVEMTLKSIKTWLVSNWKNLKQATIQGYYVALFCPMN